MKTSSDSGKLIPFVWNEAQHMTWQLCCEMMEQGLPIDIIILKARQLGISTFFLALIFWRMWRENNVSASIFAHEKDPTLQDLNKTMAVFYEGLPEGFRPQLRQKSKDARVGLEGVHFADRNSFAKFVVQRDGKGRGTTSDLNLFTEVSFYKNAKEFFGSYMAAMTKGSGGLIVQESTAKDGYFKDAYTLAKNGDTSGRRALFIAWWQVPSLNSRPIEWRGRKNNLAHDPFTGDRIRFDDDEVDHMKHLNRVAKRMKRPAITFEQMYWRQYTIQNRHGGDEDFFNQEHPWCEEVAFQYGSRSAFKSVMPIVGQTILRLEELMEQGVVLFGNLFSPDFGFETNDMLEDAPRVAWLPDVHERIDQEKVSGMMRIEGPVEGRVYVVGADVAGEVNADDEGNDKAASVASVLCLDTREQVAEWRGHIDPWEFGTILAQIGYYYNTGMICVERNNMGVTTEDRLTRVLGYPNMYKWPNWNAGMGVLTKQNSWETNTKTKPIMMSTLKRYIQGGLFIVRSLTLFSELGSYVIKNGLYKTTDKPSDTIIASSLCCMAAEQSDQSHRLLSGIAEAVSGPASGAAVRFMLQSEKAIKSKGLAAVPIPKELPAEFGRGVDGDPFKMEDVWEGFSF